MYSGTLTSILTLANTTSADAGTYFCRADNGVQPTASVEVESLLGAAENGSGSVNGRGKRKRKGEAEAETEGGSGSGSGRGKWKDPIN